MFLGGGRTLIWINLETGGDVVKTRSTYKKETHRLYRKVSICTWKDARSENAEDTFKRHPLIFQSSNR